MNEIARDLPRSPTTQAADGIPRYRWSLAQFERLIEFGIFTEQDRIELVDGELVTMSPKGIRHEVVRDAIHQWLVEHRTPGVRHSVEIGWRPDGEAYLEPDILLFPARFPAPTVPAAEVLLLIEVADTSLPYDTGLKAETYARLGVREYWVVNAHTLETVVHKSPTADTGFAEMSVISKSEPLSPVLLAPIRLSMDSLGID